MKELLGILLKYDLKSRIFEIIFFPIKSILNNTVVLSKTIINIFTSLSNNPKVRMFDEECALNYYWYDTIAYNLKKHGRFGFSKTIHNNDYLVGNWFHISKPSIFLFWKSKTITVFFAWILIPIFNLVLFPKTPIYSSIILFFLTYIGSNYVSQLKYQNYNIIGWIFFPFLFWSLENENIMIIAFTIFMLFLTSFTAYILSHGYIIIAMLTNTFTINDFFIIVVFSAFLIVFRISPIIIKGDIKAQFSTIGSAIGLFKTRAIKYKRNITPKNQLFKAIIRIFNTLIFILLYSFISDKIPYFIWVSFAFLIINSLIARFSDNQSIDILILISSFYYLLETDLAILIIFYWIFISNPFPIIYGVNARKDFLKLEELNPINLEALILEFNKIFNYIKNEKVFISFEDPSNKYHKIFSGQRPLIEVAHYYATINNTLLLPNLWSVLSENQNSENFWTRDPIEIINKMDYLSTDFLIFYTKKNQSLPESLLKEFEVIGVINWEIYLNKLLINNRGLRWYFLKRISKLN